jgi:type 1 glutamine amidotransferase
MTKDEALKLALEALEDLGMKHYESTGEVLYKETFTAIKKALAQPEQEPVAWIKRSAKGNIYDLLSEPDDGYEPVYTTPPQRKPLTDEEIYLCTNHIDRNARGWANEFARAIEAAHGIKEEV